MNLNVPFFEDVILVDHSIEIHLDGQTKSFVFQIKINIMIHTHRKTIINKEMPPILLTIIIKISAQLITLDLWLNSSFAQLLPKLAKRKTKMRSSIQVLLIIFST